MAGSEVAEREPVYYRTPILLTPRNMEQHGYNLAVTVGDEGGGSLVGDALLTLRFHLTEDAIRRIQAISLHIGENTALPASVKATLRQALLEDTSIYLGQAAPAQDGTVYVVRPKDFRPEGK
jgi:hypothetical protein